MSQQQAGGAWPAPVQPQQPAQPQYQQAQPQQHPPGWYADPYGRHQTRWWDGTRWTEHVASHGRRAVDPPEGGSPVPVVNDRQDQVMKQVQKAGAANIGVQGGGTIFTESVLVVNQKAKLVEVNTEFAIFNQQGQQIGAVRQVGQSAGKKLLRAMTSTEAFMTHNFQIVDGWGNVQLMVTKPGGLKMKANFVVQDPMGNEIGQLAQEKVIGKPSFGLLVGGQRWGQMVLESWRNRHLSIQDYNGAEIARISKTMESLAKFMFTNADNYVIQIHRPLEDPWRSLVVASALSVDLVYAQYH